MVANALGKRQTAQLWAKERCGRHSQRPKTALQ
jgi:hypothetical protein